MRIIVVLAALAAVCNAETVLQPEELTDEIINNRDRYILYEREDGLIEVEDLYNATGEQMLSATEDDVTFYFFTPKNKQNEQIRSQKIASINRDIDVILEWGSRNLVDFNEGITQAAVFSRKVSRGNENNIVMDALLNIQSIYPRSSCVRIKESQLRDIVRLTGFNVAIPSLVIIHGWKNNNDSAVNDVIKNAALKNRNINVIVVDWSPIAKKGYIKAQGSVLAVGNYIGDFLIRMDKELYHSLHDVTIVGHSLGAHISGNAGARSKGEIQKIIGLDPAGPLFSKNNINNRLDPTDANYVHVIHTNDGLLGFDIKMGHVDYYPNGGRSQPGCGVDVAGSCAHGRAYEYFGESLNNNKFVSRLCGSWKDYNGKKCDTHTASKLGGFPVEKSPAGNYYLATNKKSPFAKG